MDNTTNNDTRLTWTDYGFGFGAANAECTTRFSLKKDSGEHTVITVYTKHRAVELTVSPKGRKIHIYEREANDYERNRIENDPTSP